MFELHRIQEAEKKRNLELLAVDKELNSNNVMPNAEQLSHATAGLTDSGEN